MQIIHMSIGKHAFLCPYCNKPYSEEEGQIFSEEVSEKGCTTTECKSCKKLFHITSNMCSDLVAYSDIKMNMNTEKINELQEMYDEAVKEFNKFNKSDTHLASYLMGYMLGIKSTLAIMEIFV